MKPVKVLSGVLLASVAALALAAMPDTAAAGGPKGCPPGLAKKGWCGEPAPRPVYRERETVIVEPRTVIVEPAPVIVRPRVYVIGDYIPRTVVYQRVYYEQYNLPRPQPGYFYANVGGKVYLLAEATQRVIEAINLFDAASR